MKKIFVSGGQGFIARNILEQLKYDFVAPIHDELDLLDPQAVAKFFKDKQFDVVIHCASIGGRSFTEGEDVFYQNITMFENIIKYENQFNKFINIGSGAEYDKQKPIRDVDEYFERVPQDYYGMAKQIISKVCEKKEFMVNLRCFGVWGKYEKENRLITSLIKDQVTTIHDCLFSYCYIDDLVKIIDWFIKNDSEFNIYNVGGVKIRLSDIAKKLNKKVNIIDDGLEYTCDDSQLRKELDFKFSDFDKCLKKYQNYIKQ